METLLTAGEGNGNPLQHCCLENPMDGGAWWAAVHRVAQSRTQLKQLSMHACIGGGNGNPLQCSCLENPRDRGAWWAAVYGVVQSRTRLKRLSMHACMHAPSKPSSILAWSPACFTYLLPFTSTIPHFYFLSHRHSPKCV